MDDAVARTRASAFIQLPFAPSVPDCVWNEKARETVPAWIMLDVL